MIKKKNLHQLNKLQILRFFTRREMAEALSNTIHQHPNPIDKLCKNI